MYRCIGCKTDKEESEFSPSGIKTKRCKLCNTNRTKNYKKKLQGPRICKGCGEELNGKEKYCSDKCRIYGNIKINKNGCWIWQGVTNTSGYGKLGTKKGRHNAAHRFSFKSFNPNIDMKNLYVLHKCHEKLCCNPDHLYLGTHEDNMRDEKERNKKGRRTKREIFSDKEIIQILEMKNKGMNIPQIYLIMKKGCISSIHQNINRYKNNPPVIKEPINDFTYKSKKKINHQENRAQLYFDFMDKYGFTYGLDKMM
jgi:HNH endonuclease